MKKNIGTPDRLWRFGFGVLFLFLSWWYASWVVFAIALFMFYQAITSWCVLYQLIGKNSCPIDHDKE
ncbi:MAG: YgaP family membrane protein [Parachlamydiaceae bacterium]